MMNILILSTNRHCLPVPVMPAGACIVAHAAEQAGHRVTVLDLMFRKDPFAAVSRAIDTMRPDVIGLSVRNIDNNDIQNPRFFVRDIVPLVDRIRKKTDAVIVLGGAAVSVMPEELLQQTGISWAVTGDGEVVFPELLRTLAAGGSPKKVPGVAWKEDGRYGHNPAAARPATNGCIWPDFGRWIDTRQYVTRLSTVPVQTKLGCHFKCTYCTYRKIEGDSYRFFDREGVIEAVTRYARSGLSDVEFVDNVFNSPYEHAIELCGGLARSRHGARLQSLELNPLFVDDALISLMERAGFRGIGITVESASDKVLEGLGKGYTSRVVRKAADVIRRHSLPCLWIFLLGGPGETKETVTETLRFAEKSIRRRDAAFFNIGIRVYPGTQLEAVARKEGALSLSPEEMLSPVFYLSPEIDFLWMMKRIRESIAANLNFINSDAIGLSYLPLIHRIGYKLGVRSPLWRFTRPIRRALGFIGLDA
jgi:radical SAM superfamily enzyme YgiQ (UPF0313 family)